MGQANQQKYLQKQNVERRARAAAKARAPEQQSIRALRFGQTFLFIVAAARCHLDLLDLLRYGASYSPQFVCVFCLIFLKHFSFFFLLVVFYRFDDKELPQNYSCLQRINKIKIFMHFARFACRNNKIICELLSIY